MTSIHHGVVQYLRDVLGIHQMVLPEQVHASTQAEDLALFGRGKKVHIFVGLLNSSESELLKKMISAMNLTEDDFSVFKSKSDAPLSVQPKLNLFLGSEAATDFAVTVMGKFIDVDGVPSVYTHGPKELSQDGSLKAQAWKDLKLAMRRLV